MFVYCIRCCRRANTKHFNSLTVLSMSNDSLTINTGAAAGLPKIQPQGVMSQGQMQQYGGNPQYVQGQPQYVQGQPQYVQGQPQYVQGQPQYVQQGQLLNPNQSVPPSYAEPLPPYTENQPPIAQPITYPGNAPFDLFMFILLLLLLLLLPIAHCYLLFYVTITDQYYLQTLTLSMSRKMLLSMSKKMLLLFPLQVRGRDR